LRNFSDEVVRLSPGERIAQGIIIPRTQAQFTLVPELLCANRGGFGSTGIR